MKIKMRKKRVDCIEKHPNLPEGSSYVLVPTIMDAAKSTNVLIHLFNPHTY